MALFAFLDESGEFRFSPKHDKFLVFTGIVTARPTLFTHEFAKLRYELIQAGHCGERFHACEDKQAVRDQVFDLISSSTDYAIHCILVRKNRVNPSLYKFGIYHSAYKTMLKYLVGRGGMKHIYIIADTPPDKAQRASLKRNLLFHADQVLSARDIIYRIEHHSSSAHALLQVADYCGWSIYRKWQSKDLRSYNRIRHLIRNEFDIFGSGQIEYY